VKVVTAFQSRCLDGFDLGEATRTCCVFHYSTVSKSTRMVSRHFFQTKARLLGEYFRMFYTKNDLFIFMFYLSFHKNKT
jgi:hypothetical protein